MQFQFSKVDSDGSMHLFSHHDHKSFIIQANQNYFSAENYIIHPNLIPLGTLLIMNENNKFQVCFSDQIYMVQVNQITQGEILACKTLYAPINDLYIELKNLVWIEDFTQVHNSVLDKLIGEFILVTKNYTQAILMPSKQATIQKNSISNLIWKKISTANIIDIKGGLVWVKKENTKEISDSLPVFLLMNKLSPSDNYGHLIGKKVTIYKINNWPHFKIKNQKKKKKTDNQVLSGKSKNESQIKNQQIGKGPNIPAKKVFRFKFFPHEFLSTNEPKFQYKMTNNYNRIICKDYPHIFEKPGFKLDDFFVSQPIINKCLGSVIGHGIVEHMIRFKDNYFKDFIKSATTKCSVNHLLIDINLLIDTNLLSDIKNESIPQCVSEFNQNIETYSLFIKRIGEGILSLVNHDVETFEGLQELSNLIGCCIIVRNFTEGYKQVKIVPNHYKIKRRPIIHLGKYFNDYFLLYSVDMMTADGYLGQFYKPKMNFPYYDEDFREERNLLKFTIKSIISTAGNIKTYLNQKLSGLEANYGATKFDQAIKLYESYHNLIYNKVGGGKIKDLLEKINFDNEVNEMTGKKYFCSCGCVMYLDEASYPKHSCNFCSREYSQNHLQERRQIIYCTCINHGP